MQLFSRFSKNHFGNCVIENEILWKPLFSMICVSWIRHTVEFSDFFLFLHKGAFNNYVNKYRWVGGLSNVYANKVNDQFILTYFCLLGVGGWSKKGKILFT